MITANYYTVIEFNADGRERIESAIMTIRDIVDAFAKVGGSTSDVEAELMTAAHTLESIRDGERW